MANNLKTTFAPRNVCVVGLGYIGLPTAAILASRGHHVTGVDANSAVVDTINAGGVHIVEPDLDLLVKTGVQSGRLKASMTPVASDVFILCVPTPFHPESNQPNIDYVRAAAESIAPHVRPGNLVILESTSPPGTTLDVVGGALQAAGHKAGQDYHLAHCPERVLPGAILRECVENDRVIGGATPACSAAAAEFYATFLDVWEVIRLANRHPRVNILQPGPGVGGHCIAVDPWFLVAAAPDATAFMRATRERNNAMPAETATRIARAAHQTGAKTVALLGMAYKNDIDDFRESPSVAVHKHVLEQLPDVKVWACDPYVHAMPGVELKSFEECLAHADLLALLVAHRPFRFYDWSQLRPDQTLIDFKGVLQTG